MEGNGMGWSEWIALGAAVASSVISIFSWRWAKASADAAKQANFLQLHNQRRELYLAFHELHYRLLLSAQDLDMAHVNAFFEHSRTCYLYVSNDLASQIKGFYDKCFDIAQKKDMRRALVDQIEGLWRDPYYQEQVLQIQARCVASIDEARAMAISAGPMGKAALEALRDEISTQKPRPSRWRKLIELYWKPFNWDD